MEAVGDKFVKDICEFSQLNNVTKSFKIQRKLKCQFGF